jgi:hypothetical protein
MENTLFPFLIPDIKCWARPVAKASSPDVLRLLEEGRLEVHPVSAIIRRPYDWGARWVHQKPPWRVTAEQVVSGTLMARIRGSSSPDDSPRADGHSWVSKAVVILTAYRMKPLPYPTRVWYRNGNAMDCRVSNLTTTSPISWHKFPPSYPSPFCQAIAETSENHGQGRKELRGPSERPRGAPSLRRVV